MQKQTRGLAHTWLRLDSNGGLLQTDGLAGEAAPLV